MSTSVGIILGLLVVLFLTVRHILQTRGRRVRNAQPDNARVVVRPCSVCGQTARLPPTGDFLLFFGYDELGARASNMGSFCRECDRVFCSSHAVWVCQVSVPSGQPTVYMPTCPECGVKTRGCT